MGEQDFHLQENSTAGHTLTKDEMKTLDEVGALPPEYPG
jgi:hypothetical protein